MNDLSGDSKHCHQEEAVDLFDYNNKIINKKVKTDR